MKILDVRPQTGGSMIARFDVELPFGMRIYNIKLARSPGGMRVYAPSAFGAPAATFTRDLAIELIQAAMAALGDIDPNDTTSQAAA